MLGSVVLDWLSKDPQLDVGGTARNPAELPSRLRSSAFDAERDELPSVNGMDWVVNCIGVIKPFIHDDVAPEVARAIEVNSRLPYRIAIAAEKAGARVIQIATDCAFSGRQGPYSESSPHDPLDVYGKTKSLGEARFEHVTHLRCSIIGPEAKGFVSLLSWFLKHPAGATVRGFRNHYWNGVTTLQFAKICAGVIKAQPALPPIQHVVPFDAVTKAELLRIFRRAYHRSDLRVEEVDAKEAIDRRLSTDDPSKNADLWKEAGYVKPPTVEHMVHELADYRPIVATR